MSDIENIEIIKKQIRDGLFSGGWPIISYKKVDRLLIVLKKQIDATNSDLPKEEGALFPKQMRVRENGNELLVYSKPSIGYKKFIGYVTNRLPLPLTHLNEGKNKLKAC